MNRLASDIQKNYESKRSLPWWRLFPCSLALIAFAVVLTGSGTIERVPPAKTAAADLTAADLTWVQFPNVSETLPLSAESIERKLQDSMSPDQLSAANLTAANQVITALAPADWLGPLAPLALSPFFGITCLSGLAIWSPDWMPGSGLLNQATPLKSPTLFWVFAVLTVVTSLPKLSKVSKPLAAVIDNVEAYAGIITLLVIRYMATSTSGGSPESDPVLQAGVLSFSLDALLYIAMIINVLVINSVKFFFEFLIWLTPIPLLDACFEVANKTMCAALISIYAFSPMLATFFNLILFAGCLVVLRWINRRVRYFRHMVFDSIWPMLSRRYGNPERDELIVFPKTDWNGFQDKACLTLFRNQGGWMLRQTRWFRSPIVVQLPPDTKFRIRQGWVVNSLDIMTTDRIEMSFSRRYHRRLRELAERFEAEADMVTDRQPTITAKAEFS